LQHVPSKVPDIDYPIISMYVIIFLAEISCS